MSQFFMNLHQNVCSDVISVGHQYGLYEVNLDQLGQITLKYIRGYSFDPNVKKSCIRMTGSSLKMI